MKAVLALVIIYVAMFFLAIQGASQNSAQALPQGSAGQAGHSIDPAKEADIRSLMELVGARDAMQDFAAPRLRPLQRPRPEICECLHRRL
jgi:hypothetical protein